MDEVLKLLIFLGGLGHIVLSAGSLLVPRALQWKIHLGVLRPLLRQMFWTYAAYILVINFCFGVLSLIANEELLNHSILASSITFFICVYWLARVAIQFFYFDRTDAPKGFLYTAGEVALVLLFVAFTVIYGAAFFYNMKWM